MARDEFLGSMVELRKSCRPIEYVIALRKKGDAQLKQIWAFQRKQFGDKAGYHFNDLPNDVSEGRASLYAPPEHFLYRDPLGKRWQASWLAWEAAEVVHGTAGLIWGA